MRVKLSNYLAQKLVDSGITRGYSVVGGGAMHLNDAFGHQDGLTITYNHHEQACAIAAECYARIANKVALVCVTTGPGGTNAITGVVGGWLDSIPMFIVSGQMRYDWTARSVADVAQVRALGDQEFDICKAIDCMTKYSEMVIDPMRIRYVTEKALYLCYHGRPGPVWLDIPINVQGAYIETDDLIGFDADNYEAGGDGWAAASSAKIPEDEAGKGEKREPAIPLVTKEEAKAVIERVRSASRPVLNVGNAVRIADCHDAFMSAAHKLGIPVVVGWNSEDCMPCDDPLYVGRPGNFGDRPGNFAVQNADLVLSVGSRLSIRQVGYNCGGWARDAYVIMNDIDKNELDKPTLHVDMKIHADCAQFLAVLNEALDEETLPVWNDGRGLHDMTWRQTIDFWKRKYPVVLPKHLAEDDSQYANVYALTYELSSQARENQITVVGNGSPCVVGGHAYIMKKGQRFVSNSAIASMGYGLPASIGACEAAAEMTEYDKDIICFTGDGSIQMNLQELETVIFHKMPIKIFVVNNGGYHSIRQTQKRNFSEHKLVGIGEDSGDIGFPDMEKLAWAYGYPYVKIMHNSELHDGIAKTLATAGPVICEVYVTRDQNFEPKSSGKVMPDGTITSPPLEDLEPFLSDEELADNMLVK